MKQFISNLLEDERKIIPDYFLQQYDLGREQQRREFLNQKANQHDQEVRAEQRRELREKIEKNTFSIIGRAGKFVHPEDILELLK